MVPSAHPPVSRSKIPLVSNLVIAFLAVMGCEIKRLVPRSILKKPTRLGGTSGASMFLNVHFLKLIKCATVA